MDCPVKIDSGQFGVSESHKPLRMELPELFGNFFFRPKQGKQQNGTPKTDLSTADMMLQRAITMKTVINLSVHVGAVKSDTNKFHDTKLLNVPIADLPRVRKTKDNALFKNHFKVIR